jgi:hypothetical protein
VKRTNKRLPKLPDELLPIVDAVVDVVFERLKNAAAATKKPLENRPPPRPARLNLPLPKQRTALAEALADLLLADLARPTRMRKKNKKPKGRTPRRPSPRSR